MMEEEPEEKHVEDLIFKIPEDLNGGRFGSSPVRNSYFLSSPNDDEIQEECLDCQAMSHVNRLYSLNEDTCAFEFQRKLRDALIFVLENTEWPSSND